MLNVILEVLLDAAIWGAFDENTRPNQLPGSIPRSAVSNGVSRALGDLQFDANIVPASVLKNSRLDNLRKGVGSTVWKQFEEAAERLRTTVRQVAKGLSADEIRVLQGSESANALLTDYLMTLNHVSTHKNVGADLMATLEQGLPKLKENLHAHAKTGAVAHSFDDILRHVANDAGHLSNLRRHAQGAQTVRAVNQAYSAGFSSFKNFTTSLGSAAKFNHIGVSTMFYVGAAGLAHSAYDVFRPETKQEADGSRKHSWRTTVVESTLSMGLLLGSLVMAGRRINIVK